MRIPKRWALILAGCAIAAVVSERASVLTEPRASVKLAEKSGPPPCAPFGPPAPSPPGAAPSVAQPGGLDPMGVSHAIHSMLEDCP
jgi:hypothetical protein